MPLCTLVAFITLSNTIYVPLYVILPVVPLAVSMNSIAGLAAYIFTFVVYVDYPTTTVDPITKSVPL